MASLSSQIDLVRNYLKTQFMFVDDEWIQGCVEYLTEDSSNNYTVNELNNLAKEQWLLNDLKDICPGSLPTNLKNVKKTTLTERYVLQINAVMDIGTPAYQQYQKLQKINLDNVEATTKFEDKISSHRMIKLYLTDGVQEITAIEYKPMRNLSCDITPGCKALFKGPIECRRGMLLLTESNIELLGGEVQEIAVSNSLAGLLTTKLSLPLIQANQPTNTNIPTPHERVPRIDNPTFEPTPDLNPRPVARVTSLQVTHNQFNDEEIDLGQLDAIEAQFTTTNKRPSEGSAQNAMKKVKMDTVNDPNDYPNDEDLFAGEDEDYLRELETKLDREIEIKDANIKHPILVSSEPFVYIKQINDLSDIEKDGKVFRIKGQIMRLLSKLSVSKDGWSLRCTLVDGTGSIDVDFTSDVLSKLVGYTPSEMTQLKKQIASNPELKEKAVSALQKARDTLQVLYCIIELRILDTAKITKLIPFEDSHAALVKKRLEDSAL